MGHQSAFHTTTKHHRSTLFHSKNQAKKKDRSQCPLPRTLPTQAPVATPTNKKNPLSPSSATTLGSSRVSTTRYRTKRKPGSTPTILEPVQSLDSPVKIIPTRSMRISPAKGARARAPAEPSRLLTHTRTWTMSAVEMG